MKAPTHKWRHGLLLAIFLFSLLNVAKAQEIPNGDGDLLWERPLNGRTVNDAKFHPINGNIIAAVNHEIWEIDPKDGHTIRVMYCGTSSEDRYQFHSIDITSDGETILTDNGDSIFVWDYEKGSVKQTFQNGETIAWDGLGGVYPDNNRIVYFSYNSEQQIRKLNIYEITTNSIIKSISTYPKSADQVNLSKDGRYLAIGFRYRPTSNMLYTMELWDAETLTKIKDFGSPGDIHEFRDVQISDDNQYVGFLFSAFEQVLNLYNIQNNELLQKLTGVNGFSFISNSNKMIYSTLPQLFNPLTSIVSLPNFDTHYSYRKISTFFRINKDNDIFSRIYDTTNNKGECIKLMSNHWYEVGVTNHQAQSIQIKNTSYTNNSLQISTEGIEIINTLVITDTLGKKIFVKNEIPILNNQTEIPLFLPSGNYLLKIVSNGKEYTSKFIVSR